ncbi:MAG TPA: hypothetical protein VNI84_19590 [Pyrinomonadaceae bacterium]|nr:hypothetical protein [Pyrinomonadaceae bacterium]
MTNNELWQLAIKNSIHPAYRPDWRARLTSDELRLLRIAIILAAIILPFAIFAFLTV